MTRKPDKRKPKKKRVFKVPRTPAGERNKQKAFLAAFRETCSITEAAEETGIARGAHYKWLEDPKYAAAFEAAKPQARDVLRDRAVRLARKGTFEPAMYQGKLCFASRKRVLCKLANGTTAFEDELPKGAKVIDRRTVITNDGEQLGTWRVAEGTLARMLVAYIPEEFGNKVELTGKGGAQLVPDNFTVTFVRPKPADEPAK